MKVIAEIGVNHDGSVEKALAMVDACKRLGADYAKFQIFETAKLATSRAPRAAYQAEALGAGSQEDMLRSLELSRNDFVLLKRRCDEIGIAFLATPFDEDSAVFLTDILGCRVVKVGSGDMDNLPLIMLIASKGVDMVVSTGMATVEEIKLTLDAIAYGRQAFLQRNPLYDSGFPSRQALAKAGETIGREALAEFLTLLHCTSEYPAKHANLNMSAITVMKKMFYPIPIGFSDHSTDDVAAIMAVTLGATILERHITYDTKAKGPDHSASLDEDQFDRMMRVVSSARAAAGKDEKVPSSGEITMRSIARKRVLAARPIKAGDRIALADVVLKRSSGGRPAGEIVDVIGKTAARDAEAEEPLYTE